MLIMPEEKVNEEERELRKYYNSTKGLDEDLKKFYYRAYLNENSLENNAGRR